MSLPNQVPAQLNSARDNGDVSGIVLPDGAALPRGSDSFMKWLFFFLRPYAALMGGFFIIRIVRYSILMMLPLMIGLTIKAFEEGWGFDHPERLAAYAGVYIGLYGLCLLSMGLFFFESAAQDRAVRGMTLFSIRHMNSLPLGWHEAQGSGGKLQRVMTARNSLKQLFDMYKWYLVPFIGSLIAITVSVAAISAPLFFLLFYAGFILSFVAAGWAIAKPLSGLHNRHNQLLERLTSGVYEFVGAVRTVKAFGMDSYIDRKAALFENDGHKAMRDVFRVIFTKWTALNMIAYFWLMAFFVSCAFGVLQGWLGIGAFATLFFLAHDLWRTLESLVYVQDQFIEHRNGFMRMTETLRQAPLALDIAPLAPLPAAWRRIVFSGVSFRYRDAQTPALSDIDLEIGRGEKIALVGPSGAGKSTLIKLLLKQVAPDEGYVRIDGTDLRHIHGNEWIAGTGFVPQDVELFNMTVRENVLLDRMDDTGAEAHRAYRAALRQAALDGFIDGLADGDATLIGERGIKLSGGQRQRLGIARALVRQAELIVFDEATSSLDSLSEQAIQQAIAESFAGKTLVVIAHRLSTVRHVDRIFVLDGGRLVEQGSFAALIAKGGTFAKMWALQSSGFSDSAAA